MIDAYTTSSHYPYAQQADTTRLPTNSGLQHDFNYIRNSVKVAVDAYDGDVTFYIVDDPIAAAYDKAFPRLFTLGDEVPDELRAHFRYPEDLFRVQTNIWGHGTTSATPTSSTPSPTGGTSHRTPTWRSRLRTRPRPTAPPIQDGEWTPTSCRCGCPTSGPRSS